jgi:6-phosphogluconolactonase (cycloisomerase 2 family)
MDISPDGQWLIALDRTVGVIDEFQINSNTGALTPLAVTYSASGTPNPMAIRIAPNAHFVFAALGTAGDIVFPFNTASGAFSTGQQFFVAGNQSDNALAVDSTSTYLYIARSGTNGGLAVDAINGGALSAVSGSPFAAGTQPFSVVLNKAGTDVYVANRSDGTISGFSIAAGAALTALSGSPYSAGSAVTALAVDNSGSYLLAAAQGGTPDLALYSYDATTAGKLDLAASTATGTDPTQAVAIAATH